LKKFFLERNLLDAVK